MEDRIPQRQATLNDVLREAPEAFFDALFYEARAKPSYEGVLAAIALGQTGVLGNAREAIATLRAHWISMVPSGSAPLVRGTHSTKMLRAAAREAGLPSGLRRDLLERLPRGCPPRLYNLVQQWARVWRAEKTWEVVAEINKNSAPLPADTTENSLIRYKTGRICLYQAKHVPFSVPVHYLIGENGLVSLVHEGYRWYKTADVAKVAFTYHGPKLSAAHRERIEAATKGSQKELDDVKAKERMGPLVVALSMYFKDLPRVKDRLWALERHGKRVSEAYAYDIKSYKRPIQIKDAVRAHRQAAWFKLHMPNVEGVAEERFSREHFVTQDDFWAAVHAGKAGRGEHSMILVSALGPRRAGNLVGAPDEVIAAVSRRLEVDAALASANLEENTSRLRLPKGGILAFKDAGIPMLGLFLAQVPAVGDGRPPPTLEQALAATL